MEAKKQTNKKQLESIEGVFLTLWHIPFSIAEQPSTEMQHYTCKTYNKSKYPLSLVFLTFSP